jgi:hypothetical protein
MFSQGSKLAVLESKLSMYEELSKEMLAKLERAVEKISEGNNQIATILTKHDERIDQNHKTDQLIIKMIEDLEADSKEHYGIVSKRIDKLEEDVQDIGKIKWMTVGCGVLLAVLTTAFSTLASGWWTPSEMQMQHEGHVHQQSVNDQNVPDK